MKVLSLFDGMSCGMIAFQELGIIVDQYHAYEIDKFAIETSEYNFPQIEHHGDVFEADFQSYEGFDFLIGGSPCTYWSVAQSPDKRETTSSGMGWELFSQYVRALKQAKPKYFLYENNYSMSKAIRKAISDTFGFEPIMINSALVSAQNRKRLYWCGIRQSDGTYAKAEITQPDDLGILLKDILNTGEDLTSNDKSFCLTARYQGACAWNTIERSQRNMVAEPINVRENDKAHTLKAQYHKNSIANFVRDYKDSFTFCATGVAEPVCLNSKSGRNGIDGLQPSLQDRIYSDEGKSTAVTTAFMPKVATSHKVGVLPNDSGELKDTRSTRIYSVEAKATTQCANGGGMGAKTGLYAVPTNEKIYEVKDGYITVKDKPYPIKLKDGYYVIRKLTVRECARLQTVPEYFGFPVSKTQAYKQLGNGWTVRVIMHLIQGLLSNKTEYEEEQLSLF